MNAIHLESLLKIDFIVRKDDAYHREEFDRRVERQLGMATGMFGTAKQLVLARLRDRGISDAVELKMAALEQLYGNELTESPRAGVRTRLISRATEEDRA